MDRNLVFSKDKDIMGGTKVFPNTRVPILTFLDYLKAGDSVDQFLEDFPSVQREQVILFLDAVRNHLNDVA